MHLLASHKFAGRKRGEQKKNELEFHKGERHPQTPSVAGLMAESHQLSMQSRKASSDNEVHKSLTSNAKMCSTG